MARRRSTSRRCSDASRRGFSKSVSAWARLRQRLPRRIRKTTISACEVHTPGVGSLCKLVAELDLHNLRIVQHDAVEVLRDMLAPAFTRRRASLLSRSVAEEASSQTTPAAARFPRAAGESPAAGGIIHCATDWQDYAQQMLAVLSAERMLENTAPVMRRVPTIAHRPASSSAACASGTASGICCFAGGRIHSSRKITGRINSRDGAQLTRPIA
jgi:hypothetical protein